MSVTVKHTSMFAAVGTSVVFATYDGWLSSRGMAPAGTLFALYRLIVLVLLATWLIEDARGCGRSGPSIDQGWFVMFVFPLYLSYYLFSTRQWRGVLILSGLALLLLLPAITESLVGDVS
jgi:hypothetical protein